MASVEEKGIPYRGKVFRASAKTRGGHRLMEPEEGLEFMRPFLRKMELTRFVDITGLRTVGIPAVNAIRPSCDCSTVTHGKGITTAHAMASAAGESIERYCWYNCSISAVRSTYDELKDRYAVIPVERLALSRFSLFRPDMAEWWMTGWDIMRDEEVAVPYSSVSKADTRFAMENRSFQSTSNGLAYGVEFLEALSQAIEEVVERDAVTCMDIALFNGKASLPEIRVIPSTIPFASVRELIEKFELAGLLPVLMDCTTDTAIPVYNCLLFEEGLCYVGSGASLNPETAMSRALTEAALSHAVLYSGVRDIYFRDERTACTLTDTRKKRIAASIQAPAEKSAENLSSLKTGSFEGDINLMKDKLKNVGIDQIIVIDLPLPDLAGSVVKVIVPGLEGYHHYSAYQPGFRAESRMKGSMA